MILDDIVAHKKKVLAEIKSSSAFWGVEQRAEAAPQTRGFAQALRQAPHIALIAEIKQASPSAGVIRKHFDSIRIAKTYERCGASGISVVTDERFFQGSLARLERVRQQVTIPVLRKDFILDPLQIYEARAAAADAVLLIVSILSDRQLKEFTALTHRLNMDALVEVHSGEELDRALGADAGLIGINNRDLKTFSVSLKTTLALMERIPEGVCCVSESGIHTRRDMETLADAGVDAVLVGTSLMQAEDIGAKVTELLGNREAGA